MVETKGVCHVEKRERPMQLYPSEMSTFDIVGESGYLEKVKEMFGIRALLGTACAISRTEDVVDNKDKKQGVIVSTEEWLRELLGKIAPERTVEIGVWRGVTTALLAHYSKGVLAIDINYQEHALYLWKFFGVFKKIEFVQVENNEAKRELLEGTTFDFAFIDAMHTYDDVKLDFECVKKCERVLFHDYGGERFTGVTQFIDELPEEEVFKQTPFAYWERGAKWQK